MILGQNLEFSKKLEKRRNRSEMMPTISMFQVAEKVQKED